MATEDFLTSASSEAWKKKLEGQLPAEFQGHIDHFEMDIILKKKGRIEDKLFAETRLRMGAYGQRYDNGRRHDGTSDRKIPFPAPLAKGPNTEWDAPGMQRIKLPFGALNAEQMDLFADLAEEYSDGISHITTRQDIQLHFVHIENTPSMFRRLAAAGITTREACGNSVRNITADPLAGVSPYEAFDVTPYVHGMFLFLLGHPDVQDFGRKFKIAFSGDLEHAGGLIFLHDYGLVARVREEGGKQVRGFDVYVGGGLGAVPYKAKLLQEFVPEAEILPLTQAVCRVFARYGEKKKRHRARIKFLVADWGIEKFREEVLAERQKLTADARWSDYLGHLAEFEERPSRKPGRSAPEPTGDAAYDSWLKFNVTPQKQEGYLAVTVACPLGDITSNQLRGLADLAREFVPGTVRTNVEQNLVFRWVSTDDVQAFYDGLVKLGLGDPGAGALVDVTACPGTDTCKLGVASSRGLASVLRETLQSKFLQMDEAIQDLKIKVSGCFNSCGQHHVSDIGFYGIGRNVSGYVVPHFQLVLGGQWKENGGEYGLPIGGLPSKAIPNAVDRLTSMYLEGREKGEGFRDFTRRVGKVEIMSRLKDLTSVPPYDTDKSYYVDWGDVREFSVRDKGMGECAGELVGLADFGLKAADREIFEAQIAHEKDDYEKASELAYQAMLHAAQALIRNFNSDISDDPGRILLEFRERLHDTELFHDPIAGDKFASYFFAAHEEKGQKLDREQSHRLLQESQLFIDAAHSCNLRIGMQQSGPLLSGKN